MAPHVNTTYRWLIYLFTLGTATACGTVGNVVDSSPASTPRPTAQAVVIAAPPTLLVETATALPEGTIAQPTLPLTTVSGEPLATMAVAGTPAEATTEAMVVPATAETATAVPAPPELNETPPPPGQEIPPFQQLPPEPSPVGLQRRDAPPPGVPPEVQLAAGGGWTCQALPDAELGLRITLYESAYEVAEGFALCLSGGDQQADVDMEVLQPDGTTRAFQVSAVEPFGPEALLWVVRPGDPLGSYTVTARQGDQVTTASFDVRPASQPRIVVFPKADIWDTVSGPPGTAFLAALAGFEPAQQVTLHIYRSGSDVACQEAFCATYVTTLPPVQVDVAGQAVVPLDTDPADPPGNYHVIPRPAVARDIANNFDFFTLEQPASFVVGQQAVTIAGRDPASYSRLWTASKGGEPVFERPLLYGGSLVTILELGERAVLVRTDDGIEGWIHEPASSALSADLQQSGDRARFIPGSLVEIVWANGIPLRSEPHPGAPKVRDRLPAGLQATMEGIRGDWLRVTLDDGTSGWARWYYDGTVYVDVKQ